MKDKGDEMLDESKTLYLCMGSACHRLGVYDILPKLQALIASNDLEGKIAFKGHFCLGNCSEGVVVRFGEQIFERILPENVECVFEEQILPAIQARIA